MLTKLFPNGRGMLAYISSLQALRIPLVLRAASVRRLAALRAGPALSAALSPTGSAVPLFYQTLAGCFPLGFSQRVSLRWPSSWAWEWS
jgi:hypothetical protein